MMIFCGTYPGEVIMTMKKISAVLAVFTAFGLTACGDDDSSSSPQSKKGDSLVEKTVTGVCEKGSFVKGSKIVVHELDSVTLEKTGKTIKGEIKDNKGNLKNRTSANINTVTHMRYDRQKELIENGEKSFEKASKQAGQEILSFFGIEGDVEDAEDLSLSKAAKGDSTLLKISATIASTGDEDAIVKLMEKIGNDIKEDGVVDNKDVKKSIQQKLDNWDEIVADVKDAEDEVERKMADTSAFVSVEDDSSFVN